MTRKDYVMIADSIRGAINFETEFNNNEAGADAIKKFSFALALTLQADNPRFDRDRFLDACGVN